MSQIFKNSVGKIYHCGNSWCVGRAKLQCIIFFLSRLWFFTLSGFRLLHTIDTRKFRVLLGVTNRKCLKKSKKNRANGYFLETPSGPLILCSSARDYVFMPNRCQWFHFHVFVQSHTKPSLAPYKPRWAKPVQSTEGQLRTPQKASLLTDQ